VCLLPRCAVCSLCFTTDCFSCSISDFSQDLIDGKLSYNLSGHSVGLWSMSISQHKRKISLPSRVLLWSVIRFHTGTSFILLFAAIFRFAPPYWIWFHAHTSFILRQSGSKHMSGTHARGDSLMKRSRMLVVLVTGINQGLWSHWGVHDKTPLLLAVKVRNNNKLLVSLIFGS